MKSRIILKLFFVFAVIVLASSARAAAYMLGSVDDSGVCAEQPDANYGAISGLATGWVWRGNNVTWLAYLKFDLGAIPSGETITGASLNLYLFLGAGYAAIGTNLYRITNDHWSESSITWNNQPAGITPSGAVLGTLLVGVAMPLPYDSFIHNTSPV